MKPAFLLLAQLWLVAFSHAATLSPTKREPSSRALPLRAIMKRQTMGNSTQSSGLGNVTINDLVDAVYTINITVGGQPFTVQLDTGSADLWVQANGSNINITNTTTVQVSEIYATTTNVSGPIDFAEVTVGGYTIPSQAFINANVFINEELPTLGVSGIMGLSFNDPVGSPVNQQLQQAFGNDTTLGSIPIINILNQNTNLSNSFDIALQRTVDTASPQQQGTGLFVIGDHEPGFENVTSQPELPKLFPGRWSIPLQNVTVNGITVPLGNSTVSGVPNGTLSAILDTGFALPPIPPALVDAIYGAVPGAVKLGFVQNVSANWLIPCSVSPNVSFTFGSTEFPVHPLDMTVLTPITLTIPTNTTINGTVTPTNTTLNSTICTNSFTYLNGNFFGVDLILGTPFLKNVYASFNYGNRTEAGNHSFVQLLSTTNMESAWPDFVISRSQALAQAPPAIDPTTLLTLFGNGSGTIIPGSNVSSIVTNLFENVKFL